MHVFRSGDVRVELATPAATPPRALAVIDVKRDKRQVSPAMLTAKGPEPKRAMLEDSEEEEDGTDADVRRWMEAEHTEAEFAEEDADEEVYTSGPGAQAGSAHGV
jgi:hypothetical protein